jgi:hypothetical protein
MRGGLGGNKEFEDAEIEVKSEDSGWMELIVEGELGKNNSRRLADAQKARAAAPPTIPVSFRARNASASRPGTLGRFHVSVRVHDSVLVCRFNSGPPRIRTLTRVDVSSFSQARSARAWSASDSTSSSVASACSGKQKQKRQAEVNSITRFWPAFRPVARPFVDSHCN